MHHIHALEKRSLLAANGLDPGFGTNGVAALTTQAGYDNGAAVLAQSNAIYVEARSGNVFGITKLRDNGSVDTTWGNNGTALIGFDPSRLFFDRWKNTLYVAGVTATNTGVTLSVSRLDKNGNLFSTYDVDGKFTYSLDSSSEKYSELKLTTGVVESDGQLVLGLEQRVRPEADENDLYPTSETQENLLLMRLNANGTYDRTFGRRGVVILASGSQRDGGGEFDYFSAIDKVDLTDLIPRSDGTYVAVISRDKAYESGSNSGSYSEISGDFSVIARRVSNTGAVDASRDRFYSISRTGVGGVNRHFNPLLVAGRDLGDGDVGLTVFGSNEINGLRAAPIAVNIFPGGRTSVSALPSGVAPYTVLRNNLNQFFLVGPGKIAKLASNFRTDVPWGNGGIVTTTVAGQFVPDADGRLVSLSGSPAAVTRLDGRGVGSGVAGTVALEGDQITVLATSLGDTIEVRHTAATTVAPARVVVTLNGEVFSFRYRSSLTTIRIDAGGGDDLIVLGGLQCVTNVAAGRGNDTVNAADNFGGRLRYDLGAGRDILFLGAGESPRSLIGGEGIDTLNAIRPGTLGSQEFETLIDRSFRS